MIDSAPVTARPEVPAWAPVSTVAVGTGWLPEAPGGLERLYHALARHLPEAGVRLDGLVLGSEAVARETEGAVRAFAPADAPLPVRLRAARVALHDTLDRHRPDLVATHFALYAWPALGRLREVPHVVHFHGPWADESAGQSPISCAAKRHVERRVYATGDRFIVLSEAFAGVLARGYGVPRERIAIVPGGVDLDRFHPMDRLAARRALGWPGDRPVVLTVRRLTARMGLDRLVEAIDVVRRAVPEVLLLVAGTGPMAAPLAAQIEALGLGDHVRLLGFVPEADLPAAYAAADLSVMPSLALEGFGLAAAESLAAGTPPLVTPVGGLPEVVHDLGAHLVFEGTEPEALARGLAEALRGDLPVPDAAACRAYAEARFGWPLAAERTAAVYRDALRGAP